MLEIDLRNRFLSKYEGEINDPILNILLDTIEAYQKELQDEMLISAYTSWNNEFSDGFFEVLRRNLFGQFFPGPVFTVVNARLSQFKNADPFFIDRYHHLSIQDNQGNKAFFSPHKPSWIVPNSSNSVIVDTENNDLILGFNIYDINALNNDINISTFFNISNPLILERIKSQISLDTGLFFLSNEKKSVFSSYFPLVSNTNKDFFETPFYSKFINIPVIFFKKNNAQPRQGEIARLRFKNLAIYAEELEKNIFINSFTVWNVVEKETVLTKPYDKFRYKLVGMESDKKETIITRVYDTNFEPPIEYFNRSNLMEPAYPYQFSISPDKDSDSILLSVLPQPKGHLKIKYFQYNLSDNIINMPPGKSFTLYKGLDEEIYSLQSLTPSTRNEALIDKRKIWEYFREQLVSRHKLITKDDLKTAVVTFPPFATISEKIDIENIIFNEKTGRVNGYITTYTEIAIPVDIDFLHYNPEKKYFEYILGSYLKQKTINGNFLSVKFIRPYK